MKTLKVLYTERRPKFVHSDEVVLSSLKQFEGRGLENILTMIESGHVNQVTIVGRNMSFGWRIFVNRPVEFSNSEWVDPKSQYVFQAKNLIVGPR